MANLSDDFSSYEGVAGSSQHDDSLEAGGRNENIPDAADQHPDPDNDAQVDVAGNGDFDSDDTADSVPAAAPLAKPQVLFTGLRSAILAVTGDDAGSVFAVGADLGKGDGPNFLHFDGASWRRQFTGVADGDLWWISVKPIDGRFYMAGDPGLVLSYDPATDQFADISINEDVTLFGVWGESANDLWAVGGDLDNSDDSGVICHFDGRYWSFMDLSDLFPDGAPILYKVWGRSSDEVYAVGRLGTVMMFDGDSWSLIPCETDRTLFTIHGNDKDVAACGGAFDAVIVEDGETGFESASTAGMPQMNGVFVPHAGWPVAVGIEGAIAVRDGNRGWQLQDAGLDTILDLHGVWVDAEGGIWAVGGDLTGALSDGMVVYFGRETISTEVVRE